MIAPGETCDGWCRCSKAGMRSYWPGRSSLSRCRSTSCFPPSRSGSPAIWRCSKRCGLWTGREVFINLFNYWLKIFAVAFGMGVVSGIVMSYQFGTNWSAFSDKVGPVIGPLMAYEVLTAFFLEAGFLGVMLFGLEARRPQAAFHGDADGRDRHADFGVLDSVRQFLDADADRPRHQRRRAVHRRRLAESDLQPVIPLPPRAHGAGGVSDHCARGRRGRRLAPAARPPPRRRRA